jgi:hypothetical protein
VGRLWVYVLAFCPMRFLLCCFCSPIGNEWLKSSLSRDKNALNPSSALKRALYYKQHGILQH